MNGPDHQPGSVSLGQKAAPPSGADKMRILLQHHGNGHYLLPSGEWTARREKALAFSGSKEALAYCDDNGIRNVSLRYSFPDDQYDFCLHPFVRNGEEKRTPNR